MRQKHPRRIAQRVVHALLKNRAKAWTWLMTQLDSRVQADHNGWRWHNRGSPMKKSHYTPAEHPVAHPRDSSGCALFTFAQSAEMSWPDEVRGWRCRGAGEESRGWPETRARFE